MPNAVDPNSETACFQIKGDDYAHLTFFPPSIGIVVKANLVLLRTNKAIQNELNIAPPMYFPSDGRNEDGDSGHVAL